MDDVAEPPEGPKHRDGKRRWFSTEPPWWVRDILVAGLVGLILTTLQISRDDHRAADDQRLSNLSFVRDKTAGPSTSRNFQNIDLEGMNISGLQLASSKFQKADLKGIKADQSTLTLSNFDGAKLTDGNLGTTRLEAVNLSNADA
jgi:uncharacterized protein YjbI with pentapeptide repeats